MIVAPERVIATWHELAYHAAAAATPPPGVPGALSALEALSPDMAAWVEDMRDTLVRVAGALLASAAAASTPVDAKTATFFTGLRKLALEVAREQEADLAREAAGEAGSACPLPQVNGDPFRCGCGPEGRAACESLAFTAGLRPDVVGPDEQAGPGDGER